MKDITKYFNLKQDIKVLINSIGDWCEKSNKNHVWSINKKDLLKKKENLELIIKMLKGDK